MALGLICVCILAAFYTPGEVQSARLSVSGNQFKLGNDTVFLSGANLAWIHYGYDFGNDQWKGKWSYQGARSAYKKQIEELHAAGGNTIRVWVHIQGESSPQFNRSGYVTGLDRAGTFLNDFMDLLDLAKSNNILVIAALWSGARDKDRSNRLHGLIMEETKLNSYINNALLPWVKRVDGHPALAAWEIMNEPEGMIKANKYNPEPCFDTRSLRRDGIGWAADKYEYDDILRFINWQAAAIKRQDPDALVTVGAWNPKSNTDKFNMVNHYSDKCLVRGGGKTEGVLDFYQFHTYSWNGQFDDVSPFKNTWRDYGTTKPIIVGEFDEREGGGFTDYVMFLYAYHNGYAGALSWQLIEEGETQRKAISRVRSQSGHGRIRIDISDDEDV